MNQDPKTLNCPICQGHVVTKNQISVNLPWVFQIECERCGTFKISDLYIEDKNPPWRDVRHLVSAWIRQQNKARQIPTIDEGEDTNDIRLPEWADQFRHMGFPETINEKLNALLLAYANSVGSNYGRQFSFGYPHFIADVAAKNQEEIDGLNDLLNELDYIDKRYPTIRAKGWLHIDELSKTTITSNSAFVAMWFDGLTNKYRDAATVAIQYCGYKAIVVDQQEYNDFIMNQLSL